MTDYHKSREWLLNSGIQSIDNDPKFFGGVNAWFSDKSKDYEFIYTEISGYYLSSLTEIYLDSLDVDTLHHADICSKWIINQALLENGAVITRRYYAESYDRFDEKKGIACTFDVGMCLAGLLNLYSVNKERYLIDAAINMGDFICRSADQFGNFYPLYDCFEGKFFSNSETWSNQIGSFLLKVCIGLYKLYELLDDKKYLNVINRALDNVINSQKKDGRFITNFKEDLTHIHPHCYTTEALIYIHLKTNEEKIAKAIELSARWLICRLRSDSDIFSSIYDIDDNPNLMERSDTLSQILRILIYVKQKSIINNEDFKSLFKILKSKLEIYQVRSNDIQESGGIMYGTHEDGNNLNDINTWSTQFFSQAIFWLELDENHQKINFEYYV